MSGAQETCANCRALRAEHENYVLRTRRLYALVEQRQEHVVTLVRSLMAELESAKARAAAAAASAALGAPGARSAAGGGISGGGTGDAPTEQAGPSAVAPAPESPRAGVVLQRSNVDLSVEAVEALGDTLYASNDIVAVVLDEAGLDDARLAVLASALREGAEKYGPRRLEALSLCGNALSHKGMEEIGRTFALAPRLRTLSLARCGLGDRAVVALGKALRGCVSLESLDLSGNEVVGKQMLFLAEVLSTCDALTVLNLANNLLASGAMRGVSFLIIHSRSLRRLFLAENDVSDEGVQLLTEMVPFNGTLQTLDLRDNPVSDAAAETLWLAWSAKRAKPPMRLGTLTFSVLV